MKKKILLIDDKASIAKVVSIYLGKEYDFTYCENPNKNAIEGYTKETCRILLFQIYVCRK